MDFVTTHVVSAVGITLVHFLWQGAGIGLITAAVLATCPGALARTRYRIAGAGLAAMTMAPLVTLGLVWPAAPAMTAAATSAASTVVEAGAGSVDTASSAPGWLPLAVAVWAAGVGILATRLLVAWFRTERIRRRDVTVVSCDLASSVRRIADALGVRRPVAVFESRWIDVPTVIGWLRPTLLLPIGALTGLSVQQIEAVLSHELAHIKRHDYLVNVLQNFAETIFFYHPAVWWLSKQIRIEREHCCDDVAVELCGNPVLYARALTALEASRHSHATFALAATDGSLLGRIRRLVGPAHDDRRKASLPIAACVAVILSVVVFGGLQARDAGATVERLTGAEPTDVAATPFAQMEASVFERIDAETIQLDGDVYLRRNAEDMRRLQANPAPMQRDAAPGSSADAQTGAPEPPRRAVRIGGDIKEPRKIRNVMPIYPEPARAAGISGVVILEATIDTEGMPVDIKIRRSIPDLDQAAINAVRQWRYEPTLLNGAPAPVVMTVTVNFALQPTQDRMDALERSIAELTALLGEDPRDPVVRRQLDVAQLEYAQLLSRRDAARGTSNTADTRDRPREQRPLTAPATPTSGPEALRIGGSIREPRKTHNVAPVYPAAARNANVSGVVILELFIGPEGNVTDARILRSIPMLDEAALEAVRQWRYEPTIINGQPRALQMTTTVNFTLN